MVGLMRPYCHPPFKHSASNYEYRMRRMRHTLQDRAQKIADRLKTLEDTDRSVVEMTVDLHDKANAGKMAWMTEAIDDLLKSSGHLDPGITRDRVAELVKARDTIVEALKIIPEHHQHRHPEMDSFGLDLYGGATLENVAEIEVLTESRDILEPVLTDAQIEKASIVRKSLIDIIECLSKPFWPRAPPASATAPSPYNQGKFVPVVNITNRVDKRPKPVVKKFVPTKPLDPTAGYAKKNGGTPVPKVEAVKPPPKKGAKKHKYIAPGPSHVHHIVVKENPKNMQPAPHHGDTSEEHGHDSHPNGASSAAHGPTNAHHTNSAHGTGKPHEPNHKESPAPSSTVAAKREDGSPSDETPAERPLKPAAGPPTPVTNLTKVKPKPGQKGSKGSKGSKGHGEDATSAHHEEDPKLKRRKTEAQENLDVKAEEAPPLPVDAGKAPEETPGVASPTKKASVVAEKAVEESAVVTEEPPKVVEEAPKAVEEPPAPVEAPPVEAEVTPPGET